MKFIKIMDYFHKRWKNDIGFRNTIRNHSRAYAAKKRKENKLKLMKILEQNKCIKCEISDDRCLQFDFKEKNTVEYYINHPEEAKNNVSVLCSNCKWIKRSNNYNYRFSLN